MRILLLAALLLVQAPIEDEIDADQQRALPFRCEDRSVVDLLSIVILEDIDGDKWVKARDKRTHQIELGFINHRNGKFCRITTVKSLS